ncbi:hypothetical protein V1460_33885 [Streptomyces sp. SCSIO 30461]|uniref:hypothetical protein n=1 Tax=Streptomyces sp. SCSIO 30461 TaxID=3118085 RepID=UPI0030D30305
MSGVGHLMPDARRLRALGWTRGDEKDTVIIKAGAANPSAPRAIGARKVYDYWPDKKEWVAQ